MRQRYVIFLPFLFFFNGLAQDSIVDQDVKVNEQFWLDYNFKHLLKENRLLSTQVGFRKITPKVYNRLLVISTLDIENHKNLFNLNTEKPLIDSYHLGAGLIYTDNVGKDDNFEFRLIQGFKFEIPTFKAITFTNYIRAEERFQNAFDNSGWTSAFRLRYKVSTVLDWKKHYLTFASGLYIPMEAELFFNLKKADRFNDLIRLSPGIGYKLDNNWKIEMYVIFNRTKNLTETNNKSSDFILRLRVFNGGTKNKSLNANEIDD